MRYGQLSFLESSYMAGVAGAGWPADRWRSNWCPLAEDLVVLKGHQVLGALFRPVEAGYGLLTSGEGGSSDAFLRPQR